MFENANSSDILNNAQNYKERLVKERQFLEMLSSLKRRYCFWGDNSSFLKEKINTTITLCIMLILAIITSVISFISFNLYSTFTLIENIWSLFTIVGIFMVLFAKTSYTEKEFAKHTSNLFYSLKKDKKSILVPVKPKIVFSILVVLQCVSAPLNCCMVFIEGISPLGIIVIVFECIFLVTVFLSIYVLKRFFKHYSIVCFEGESELGLSQFSTVYDQIENRWYDKKEFEIEHPYIK